MTHYRQFVILFDLFARRKKLSPFIYFQFFIYGHVQLMQPGFPKENPMGLPMI